MKSVCIFEVGCCFDLYMDTCYYSKLLKYQPLVDLIQQLGYNCKLIILVFGSLGHVHKNVIRGMQLGGAARKGSKKACKILLCFSHHREHANMETEMFCLYLMC